MVNNEYKSGSKYSSTLRLYLLEISELYLQHLRRAAEPSDIFDSLEKSVALYPLTNKYIKNLKVQCVPCAFCF